MILLSSIIKTFEAEFLAQYSDSILPSHRKALAAMKGYRTSSSPQMLVQCTECDSQVFVPHSCGIAAVRTASIMNASNGWSASFRNRCPLSIFC